MRSAAGRGKWALVSRSARQTAEAGARLASELNPGDCVCLIGPLGAGKTCFIRGAMKALGVRRRVVSPTFTLAREAAGRVPVAHLDFYRLDVPAEERGLLEYLDGKHVTFVEWADRDRSFWPRKTVNVRIERRPGMVRRIRVRFSGGRR